MVGTRKLSPILDLARASGTKVVLVGDPHQLAEIHAGGALAALSEGLGALILRENRRQVEKWERDALAALRTAIRSRPWRHTLPPDVSRSPTGRLRKACGEDVLMLASRRAQVNALNRRVRLELIDAGLLVTLRSPSEDELVDEALRRWFGLRGLAVLDDVSDRQARAGERFDSMTAKRSIWRSERCGPPALLGGRTLAEHATGCARSSSAFNDGSRWSLARGFYAELDEVLHRPAFRRHFTAEEAEEFVGAVDGVALEAPDPVVGERISRDPDDDYLVSLAELTQSDRVVSGDPDLLEVSGRSVSVVSPTDFLAELRRQ